MRPRFLCFLSRVFVLPPLKRIGAHLDVTLRAFFLVGRRQGPVDMRPAPMKQVCEDRYMVFFLFMDFRPYGNSNFAPSTIIALFVAKNA